MNGLSISPSDIYLDGNFLFDASRASSLSRSPPLSQGQSKDTLSMGPGSTGWSARIFHNYRISQNGSVCSGVESVAFPFSMSLDYPVRRGEKGEAYIRVWRRSPSCDPTHDDVCCFTERANICLSISSSKLDVASGIKYMYGMDGFQDWFSIFNWFF